MEKIEIGKLIDLAEELNQKDTPWHHHFLTPKCCFNQSDDFRIILEDEEKREVFYSEFNEKPILELKKLEKLFFKK